MRTAKCGICGTSRPREGLAIVRIPIPGRPFPRYEQPLVYCRYDDACLREAFAQVPQVDREESMGPVGRAAATGKPDGWWRLFWRTMWRGN